MITLEEAQYATGVAVTHNWRGITLARGVITGTENSSVLVRFDNNGATPMPVNPDDLEFVHRPVIHYRSRYHRVGPGTPCGEPNCSRRHYYKVECACGEQFSYATLRGARDRLDEHLRLENNPRTTTARETTR